MRLSEFAALALIVGSLCFNVTCISSAGRFRLFDIGRTGGLGREFDQRHQRRVRGNLPVSDPDARHGEWLGHLQKPAHGKLKKLNMTTYEYKAKARYKGSDSFAIKATGQGPTASGTSVITVHATIK